MRRFLHQKGFCNRICWHQEPYTPRKFYTKDLSHQKASTPEALETKELLHRNTSCARGTIVLFTKKYTRMLLLDTKELLLTAENVYSRNHCTHLHSPFCCQELGFQSEAKPRQKSMFSVSENYEFFKLCTLMKEVLPFHHPTIFLQKENGPATSFLPFPSWKKELMEELRWVRRVQLK